MNYRGTFGHIIYTLGDDKKWSILKFSTEAHAVTRYLDKSRKKKNSQDPLASLTTFKCYYKTSVLPENFQS